jgi:cell division protease FtsH
MAGRIAEDLQFNDITSGASSDISRATHIIRRMVTEWGMSDYGFIALAQHDEPLCDPQTLHAAEEMIQKIANDQYEQTKELMLKNKQALDAIAKALLENETIIGAEAHRLVQEVQAKQATKA